MRHTRSRRRRSERRGSREWNSRQTQVLLVIGSFVVGAVLEWVRSQPRTAHWGWQSDTLAILIAAWVSVALLAWWPQGWGRRLAGAAALMLLVLFLGTLITHELINHR